jgi:hypothetical protein
MAYGNATPKRLGAIGTLPANNGQSATLYTVPNAKGAVLKRIHLQNGNFTPFSSTTQYSGWVNIVVNGTYVRQIYTSKPAGSNVWVLDDVDLNLPLVAGDTVALQSPTNNGSYSAYLAGVEFDV